MKKIILASLGVALLALAVVSSVNYGFVAAQYSTPESEQQNTSQQAGNNTGQQSGGNTTTAGEEQGNVTGITEQLHRDLDTAIDAARQNNTEGVLMSLSQIMRELSQINDPEAHNITTTAGANTTSSTGNNQTGTGNTSGSGAASDNSSTDTGGTVTGGKAGDVDNPGSSGAEIPSDFPEQ